MGQHQLVAHVFTGRVATNLFQKESSVAPNFS